MNRRQKIFADEYLIDLNATQAAIRAGYSEKTARSIGAENLTKPDIKNYIEKRMSEKKAKTIAQQDEVLEYLTRVMRGENLSSEVVVEGTGNGLSRAREMYKHPSERDQLKAAELLGRRYGLFTEKGVLEINVPVIRGEADLED